LKRFFDDEKIIILITSHTKVLQIPHPPSSLLLLLLLLKYNLRNRKSFVNLLESTVSISLCTHRLMLSCIFLIINICPRGYILSIFYYKFLMIIFFFLYSQSLFNVYGGSFVCETDSERDWMINNKNNSVHVPLQPH
jgi:hypothetical protein